MAVDKLVDSSQLDSDLTSVANAIRTKGGTSASLAFPSAFISAINDIQTGGGIPTLGNYHVCMGQFTPSQTGSFTINANVGETINTALFGVIWLDDPSVISSYSSTSIVLMSASPIAGNYSTIDTMNGTSHQVQSKTAYGLKIKKVSDGTGYKIFQLEYKSYSQWYGQPEVYNYVGVYSV